MREVITLSKTGSEHLYADKNKQDFAVQLSNVKIVLDGCGSTQFPEVGSTLFGQMLVREQEEREAKGLPGVSPDNFLSVTWRIFDRLAGLVPTDTFRLNNLLFTIMACFETSDEFVVMSCGDGYILAQQGEEIEAILLDDGEYPRYFGYNLIEDKGLLKEYLGGVQFTVNIFSKNEYSNVGVATDGFRFVESLGVLDRTHFYEYLLSGRKGRIGMMINRNIQMFKDDISICF
jgi:hypothetical protein